MAARLSIAAGALTVGLAALTGWAWSAERSEGSASSERAPADGAALFQAKGCASCHDGPDTGSLVDVAPSLAAAGTWAGSRRPGLTSEEYLYESIADPSAFVSPAFTPNGPTTAMPGIAVSPAELAALVGYLLGA